MLNYMLIRTLVFEFAFGSCIMYLRWEIIHTNRLVAILSLNALYRMDMDMKSFPKARKTALKFA